VYLTEELLAPLRAQYGSPLEATAAAPFTPREFGLLEYCARKNRAHDLTVFVRDEAGRFALIRKPGYPPGVFRSPSGGAEPGEAVLDAVARETREETGLEVAIERYLFCCRAEFTCEGRVMLWTTHGILARGTGGVLEPVDRKEIAEACWASAAEVCGLYRERMLALGSAGMRYRVDLQDLALDRLGLQNWQPEPGRLIQFVSG